jgi:hypothetical protein
MRPLRPIIAGTMIAAALIIAVALSAPPVATAAAGGADDSLRALKQAPLTGEEKKVLGDQVRAALRAGVPAEDVEIIVTRSIARGAGAATLGRFLDTAAQVARQGLPVRPVLDRIEQGLSKGVPPERIDAAGKRLADGLANAKPLVDGLLQNGLPAGTGGAKDAALESVARAGEQSLSAGTMQALGETIRAQGQSLDQFERAVRTLSFLAGNGMPADAAERVVRSSIERGITEQDYGRIERKVSDMVSQGRSMDEIVHAVDREVREGRGAGESRDRGKQDRGSGGGRDAGGWTGRGK